MKENITIIDINSKKQLGTFRNLEEFESKINTSKNIKTDITYFWDGSEDIPSGVLVEYLQNTILVDKKTFKIVF